MSDVSSHTEVKMGSERSFGIVFGIVFVIIAAWPWMMHGGSIRIWALVVAAVFIALAYIAPDVLKPLNKAWFKFGMLLSKIVAPIAMGIIFFLTVTPIGLIRRMRNPDPLNQEFDTQADSYWITRETEETAPNSMRKQF